MSNEFTEAVERGVSVLDAHASDGPLWIHRVDLDRLVMMDWRDCVLGQLYEGDYVTGLHTLVALTRFPGTDVSFSTRHGFEVDVADDGVVRSSTDYARLTDTWRDRIELLRAERAIPPTSA